MIRCIKSIRVNPYSKIIPYMIFLIAILVNLLNMIFFPGNALFYSDSRRYEDLAINLISGKGYLEPDDLMTMQSPPVYPLVLTGLYYIFGHSHLPVRIFQILLNSLTILLIYLIAKHIFDRKTAFLAALIGCFYPSLILYSNVILSENVFVFLIVLSVFIWLKALDSSNLKLFILLGITLGLATLTRPTAALILLLVFLSILLFKQKRIILKIFIITCIFSFVNLPWIIRNYYKYHVFIPTVLGGGAALYVGSTNWDSKIEYDRKGNYVGAYKDFLELTKGLSPVEKDKKYRQEAFKNISTHPFRYIGAFPNKLWRLYVRPAGYERLGLLREGFFKKFLFLLAYISILIAFIIGAGFALIKQNNSALICLGTVIYFTLVHILTNSNDPRYHLPSMPFIIILASYGFLKIKERITGYVR